MDDDTPSVYLDVCALERPYDDRRQLRIAAEAEAVLLILANVQSQHLRLIGSSMHEIEINASTDGERRDALLSLLRIFGTILAPQTDLLRKRITELQTAGIDLADATHAAIAEWAGADFVTCDDRLIRKLRRVDSTVWFGSPLEYCWKEELR